MRPGSELERQLLNRIALMTVRLDRSAEHEARAIAHRMRKAEGEFADARLAEVENYFSWIASEPATNARRLRSSPEGIDRLIQGFEDLRSDLTLADGMRWDWQHCEQLHHMMGLRRMDVPVSRARALTEAMAGNFQHLSQSDRTELEKNDRILWALASQVYLIDGEIARLRTVREGLDLEGIELDRAEAAHRAIFDASPESVLARKYEAANERGFYRALREFREIQAEYPKVETVQEFADEPIEEVGSSLPDPPGEEFEEASLDPIDPEISLPVVEGAEKAPKKGPKAASNRLSGRDRAVIEPSPGH
jgi:hypothetical protein